MASSVFARIGLLALLARPHLAAPVPPEKSSIPVNPVCEDPAVTWITKKQLGCCEGPVRKWYCAPGNIFYPVALPHEDSVFRRDDEDEESTEGDDDEITLDLDEEAHGIAPRRNVKTLPTLDIDPLLPSPPDDGEEEIEFPKATPTSFKVPHRPLLTGPPVINARKAPSLTRPLDIDSEDSDTNGDGVAIVKDVKTLQPKVSIFRRMPTPAPMVPADSSDDLAIQDGDLLEITPTENIPTKLVKNDFPKLTGRPNSIKPPVQHGREDFVFRRAPEPAPISGDPLYRMKGHDSFKPSIMLETVGDVHKRGDSLHRRTPEMVPDRPPISDELRDKLHGLGHRPSVAHETAADVHKRKQADKPKQLPADLIHEALNVPAETHETEEAVYKRRSAKPPPNRPPPPTPDVLEPTYEVWKRATEEAVYKRENGRSPPHRPKPATPDVLEPTYEVDKRAAEEKTKLRLPKKPHFSIDDGTAQTLELENSVFRRKEMTPEERLQRLRGIEVKNKWWQDGKAVALEREGEVYRRQEDGEVEDEGEDFEGEDSDEE